MGTVSVQLGLFGGGSTLPEFHVVSAHTRTLADGSEVFVGEHLRWNRGAAAPRGDRGLRAGAPPDGEEVPEQIRLFSR
jgi:hypothetical protein